jgi:hypothetical protein
MQNPFQLKDLDRDEGFRKNNGEGVVKGKGEGENSQMAKRKELKAKKGKT